MTDKQQTFWERCWKRRDGRQGLAQPPNVSLVVWVLALVLAKLCSGTAGNVFAAVQYGAIFTWAWQELFKGVSYFRRLLGAAVLGLTIVSLAARL